MQQISERLETTLANIEHQKGLVHWDDFEKLEEVIKAIKELEKENETLKDRIFDLSLLDSLNLKQNN
jgi:hypothetical protein|tara:strand:+ start:338 stop:538 length:201 start_codon:yes stop_codon:yes gene_type:complete